MEPSLSQVSADHLAAKIVVALFARNGDMYDPAGSAVIVAAGWAITARHVVEGYERSLGPAKGPGMTSGHLLYGVMLTPEGGRIALRVLHAIAPRLRADLALLRLEPIPGALPEGSQWPSLTMDIRPPVVGDLVRSFGFQGKPVASLEGIVRIGTLTCSIGKVLQVEPIALSSRVDLPWGFPCGLTDAHVFGGMSGGPVFSSTGSLLGVWSSSTLDKEPSSVSSATFALIWPILSASLKESPALNTPASDSVYVAGLDGRIRILGLDWFTPALDENGLIQGGSLRLRV